ncbi:MAG: hypothetical protein ACRC4X_04415 [Cetobacterium sp.]
MFFFDDFIKKITKTKIEFRTKRKYRLEVKKLIMWIGTGLPLVLLGLLQGYMGYIKEFSIPYLGLGVLLIFLGLKHLKNIFTYKIVLDFENKRMIGEGLDLDLRDVETCVLKEGVVGKGNRLQVIIRIVTKDKREIIIPLIMGNKVDFICALRDELKEKFSIKK